MNIPTSRSELMSSGATLIAEVSSFPDAPHDREVCATYTNLSLWWIDDEQRPFIAVVEGKLGPAAPGHMVERYRASTHGTLDKALAGFDPTNLRDDLVDAIPGDAADVFPDANSLRQKRAQEARGYRGPDDMLKAVEWLYDTVGEPLTVTAKRLEADFSVPWRTAYNALNGGNLTGWAVGFIGVLRHFNRTAWAIAQEKGL